MTRISSQKMSSKIEAAITEQFVSYVARLKTSSQSELFLTTLLTDSEKIMLAKRFAIIVMLHRGNSFADIEKALKVSSSTITLMWRAQKKGEFDYILNNILPTTNATRSTCDRSFIDFLDVLLRAGMPPVVGKGRWAFLDDHFPETRHTPKRKKRRY